MSEWYVSRGGKQYGPYTWEEMRKMAGDGNVVKGDLVWSAGLKEWQEAGKVPDLFAVGEPSGGRDAKRAKVIPGESPADAPDGPPKKRGSRRPLYLYASLAVVVLIIAALLLLPGGEKGEKDTMLDESGLPLELAAIFEPDNAAAALERPGAMQRLIRFVDSWCKRSQAQDTIIRHVRNNLRDLSDNQLELIQRADRDGLIEALQDKNDFVDESILELVLQYAEGEIREQVKEKAKGKWWPW